MASDANLLIMFLAVMPNFVDVTAKAATGWFVSNDLS